MPSHGMTHSLTAAGGGPFEYQACQLRRSSPAYDRPRHERSRYEQSWTPLRLIRINNSCRYHAVLEVPFIRMKASAPTRPGPAFHPYRLTPGAPDQGRRLSHRLLRDGIANPLPQLRPDHAFGLKSTIELGHRYRGAVGFDLTFAAGSPSLQLHDSGTARYRQCVASVS